MSSRSSTKGNWGVIAFYAFLGWLVLYATGSQIKDMVMGYTGDAQLGNSAGSFWVENHPWPHSEVDAVKKCVLAIQSRNWQGYQGCFEPAAVLARKEPGLPGQFYDTHFTSLESDGHAGTVRIVGQWRPSPLTGHSGVIYIDEYISVVRARKGFLGDVEVNVDVALEGWFVAYIEEDSLPFDFSSSLSSLQPTPTPERLKTPTLTYTATATPHSSETDVK